MDGFAVVGGPFLKWKYWLGTWRTDPEVKIHLEGSSHHPPTFHIHGSTLWLFTIW